MLGFATLMFFSFTGITLNHPSWLGANEAKVEDSSGSLPEALLKGLAEAAEGSAERKAFESAIAAYLSESHGLKGKASELQADEFEIYLAFKGPGYSADAFIDADSGSYTVTEADNGAMALLNDLHKGRDSGEAWRWVIDISAVLMLLMSISGFGLLLYIRKRRTSGVLTAVAGTVVLVLAWVLWVP